MRLDKYYPEMLKHFKDWCTQNEVEYTEVNLDGTWFAGYITDNYNTEQLNITAVKYIIFNMKIVMLDDIRFIANMLHVVLVRSIPDTKKRKVCFTGIPINP